MSEFTQASVLFYIKKIKSYEINTLFSDLSADVTRKFDFTSFHSVSFHPMHSNLVDLLVYT